MRLNVPILGKNIVFVLPAHHPSEPCAAPDECDYGKASVVAGKMVACASCATKNDSPTYRCTWGLPIERVVPQAKYEVSAINRWERLDFVAAIIKQRWTFKR